MVKAKPRPIRPFRLDFHPLRVLRVGARLSVNALAESAGVSRWTVYRTESNRTQPSVEQVIALARALGRPMHELFRVVDSRDD